MLIVHRRHADACPHRHKGRDFRKCDCPLWIDWRVDRKRIQKPLGTRDWGVAQIQARKIEVDGLTTTVVPTTIESACEKFLADAEARGLKEESLRKYRQLFKQMKAFAQSQGIILLNNLTTQELLEFRTTWKNSSRSAKKKLELMKAFFRHCSAAKFISSDPSAAIKPPKVVEEQVIPFTDQEMKKILDACDAVPTKRHAEQAIKLRAMVLLMRHSGLRITDACTLARDRIHKGVLTLRTEKGGTTVRLPLHRDALAALAAVPAKGSFYFWNGQSKRRTIANYWQQLFLEMFKRAGLTGGHSHQFRHKFAVELLTHGVSMENVSTLLGHRDIKITQRTYSAFTPARREALEKAVRATW
jgi:site-specific recombinase XerD